MCDYSLYITENRLAKDGEQLILHRFSTGSLGFASMQDVEEQMARKATKTSFWAALKECLLCQQTPNLMAICIPPGARLLLTNVPLRVQDALDIGPSEMVVFTEVSSHSHSYRDSLLLPNNTQVLLQDLSEGIHALVVSLASETEAELEPQEVYAI